MAASRIADDIYPRDGRWSAILRSLVCSAVAAVFVVVVWGCPCPDVKVSVAASSRSIMVLQCLLFPTLDEPPYAGRSSVS